MVNRSIDQLEKFRERYRLSEKDFDDIFDIIVEELTAGYLPSEYPKAIILGGAPGSGKTELEKEESAMLGDNAVICNADNLRDFHPLSKRFKKRYPTFYPEITAEYAQRWNDLLCEYCQAKRLNFILETTFSSGKRLDDTIRQIKDSDYEANIMLVAVNPRLSLLGTFIRYENSIENLGLGRRVSKQAHDIRYNAIPITTQYVASSSLYDNIYIYSRNISLEYSSLFKGLTLACHNPTDVLQIYNEEIHSPWHPKLEEYFMQSCNDVWEMMCKRSADPAEIDRFREDLGIVNAVSGNIELKM
ncbi:zeta toxin family protein [Chryseobacterium sp. EZn1]|uniref:zeta toxin family protein n=1 Tax=Chryseobacterium cupriresistens TaxID=3366770 RepID=UPI0039846396